MDQDVMRLYAESVKALAKEVDFASSVATAGALARALMAMTEGVLRRLDGDVAAPIPHLKAAE